MYLPTRQECSVKEMAKERISLDDIATMRFASVLACLDPEELEFGSVFFPPYIRRYGMSYISIT